MADNPTVNKMLAISRQRQAAEARLATLREAQAINKEGQTLVAQQLEKARQMNLKPKRKRLRISFR